MLLTGKSVVWVLGKKYPDQPITKQTSKSLITLTPLIQLLYMQFAASGNAGTLIGYCAGLPTVNYSSGQFRNWSSVPGRFLTSYRTFQTHNSQQKLCSKLANATDNNLIKCKLGLLLYSRVWLCPCIVLTLRHIQMANFAVSTLETLMLVLVHKWIKFQNFRWNPKPSPCD